MVKADLLEAQPAQDSELVVAEPQQKQIQVEIPESFMNRNLEQFKKDIDQLCVGKTEDEAIEMLNHMRNVIQNNTPNYWSKRWKAWNKLGDKAPKALLYAIGAGSCLAGTFSLCSASAEILNAQKTGFSAFSRFMTDLGVGTTFFGGLVAGLGISAYMATYGIKKFAPYIEKYWNACSLDYHENEFVEVLIKKSNELWAKKNEANNPVKTVSTSYSYWA